MRVFVSGANGFIGRALCLYLVSIGHQVVPIERRPYYIERKRIVSGESSWVTALKECDSVVHLAGRAHVMQEYERHPLQAFRIANVDATLALANRAAESGVRRFVFLSTVKVNGEATMPGCRFNPDDLPAPQDPYAISKWEAEQGLLDISLRTGLEVVIIRSPLVYGPKVKGNFASLMRAVRSGWPLPLGAVHNQRSLVALGNLTDFIITCTTHPAAANQTFIVSDGQDLSIKDLVRNMAQVMGVSPLLLPVPTPILRLAGRLLGMAEVIERVCGNLQVDSTKCCTLLNWMPPLSVEEGLCQVLLD